MSESKYKPVSRRYVLQGAASLLANSALPLTQTTMTAAHSDWSMRSQISLLVRALNCALTQVVTRIGCGAAH